MVDKICTWILEKMKKQDDSIDEEKAEIIYYGLQNLIGELPKGIIIIGIAIMLGIIKWVIVGTVVLLTYRAFAGGVHLKGHVTCLTFSTLVIIGGIYLIKSIVFEDTLYIYTILLFINLMLITLYAPADTENRPIMKESQMKRRKIESYITVILIYILSSFIIKDQSYTNIMMYTITIESIMITPLAYKIFDNKTGEKRRREILSSM